MTIRSFIVEHRTLAPRVRPCPVAIILDAAKKLLDIPRESCVSHQDIMFHNRRCVKQIRDAVDRLEVEWEPVQRQPKALRLALATKAPPPREQRREITAAKGRRVRVVERCSKQMALPL